MNWTLEIGPTCLQVVLLPTQHPNQFAFLVNDNHYEVVLEPKGEQGWSCQLNGRSHAFHISQIQQNGTPALIQPDQPMGREEQCTVWLGSQGMEVRRFVGQWLANLSTNSTQGPSHQLVSAPMAGKVISLHVQPGQRVEANTSLFVLEAMKMENEVKAGKPAVVEQVLAQPGDVVEAGAPLVQLRGLLPEQGQA